MSEPKPTRIALTIGETRHLSEFDFSKISLSLDRDLAPLENPLDAYRNVDALLRKALSELQAGKPSPAGKPKEIPTMSENQAVAPRQLSDISEKQAVPPRPAASKLATLQERLGARLQDVEVVEGFDGLNVKPKKYLGESWGEINEVVRALGGHWQKGLKPTDGAWRIAK